MNGGADYLMFDLISGTSSSDFFLSGVDSINGILDRIDTSCLIPILTARWQHSATTSLRSVRIRFSSIHSDVSNKFNGYFYCLSFDFFFKANFWRLFVCFLNDMLFFFLQKDNFSIITNIAERIDGTKLIQI